MVLLADILCVVFTFVTVQCEFTSFEYHFFNKGLIQPLYPSCRYIYGQKLQEFLNMKPQMRDFTTTRERNYKTKKKATRLSFNLLLRFLTSSGFNFIISSCNTNPSQHQSISFLVCLETNLMFRSSVAWQIFSRQSPPSVWAWGSVDIASRKGVAPRGVTNVNASIILYKNSLRWFPIAFEDTMDM